MPYGVYLPGRWRSQPQGAVEVDWGHPLSAGLGLVLNAATRANHATGAAATLSSASFALGHRGVAVSSESMAGRVAQPFGTQQTILALVEVGAWRTGGAGVVSSNAGVLLFSVSVGQNGAAVAGCIDSSFQIVGIATAAGIAEVGRTHIVAGRLQNNTMDVFCGHSKSALSATFTPFLQSANTSVSHSGFAEVRTRMTAAWNRVLSEHEIYALNDNPWQILRPRRPIIYSLPSSTPVLSAATVIDIGTTSARPRVTITI